MPNQNSQGWLAKFILLGLIWGSSFLFIKLSLEIFSPAGVAFWRTALGSIFLFAVFFIKREQLPKSPKQWLLIWVSGLFMSAIPAVFFSYAELHASSGLASIMNASTPIFTVLVILIAFRAERPGKATLAGLAIGILGVGVVLAVWNGFGENDPLAVWSLIAAVTCYGIGTPFIKRFVTPMGLPLYSSVLIQVGTSALSLLPFYLLSGPLTVGAFDLDSTLSILALGAIGTGYAYVLFYELIDRAGSAIASSVTYITPLVGVLLGLILLGEKISWHEPVGGLIVLLGAAITQGRIKLPGMSNRG
jgi:drug/metabolite transporter (DMT)-like permease